MSMKVTVFDVEHGFCAFVKTPTKYTALIDCGCTDNFSPALYIAEHELGDAQRWNGYKLTRMTITHPHDDHIEDIATVKEHCAPGILHHQEYEWNDVKASADGDYQNRDIYSGWQQGYSEAVTELPDYGMSLQTFSLTPEQAKGIDESKYINNSSIVTVASIQGSQFTAKFLFGGTWRLPGGMLY